MKKRRYFPFGYHMADGKILICSEESALLRELFSCYLSGASLQQLADYAEQTGICYRENTTHWNKNMIARMLDDERYWNSDEYPSIVRKETGSAIISMRKQRATAQSPIAFIQKKLVCSNCGSRLYRMTQKFPRIRWDCKKCGRRVGATDKELLETVTEKMIAICHAPQSVDQVITPCNKLSIQAARLTNEINQMMNQREADSKQLLSLIWECAVEKYKTCGIKESDHLTMKIKTLFLDHGNDMKLDRELFDQAVKQVILQLNGSVQLRLLNEKIV
ncbi:recombinase family protein [Neglectibacter sp. CSJ-5]|uniref:recombinase family protein n=1 Tax=Neglectibacter sp. CSJ-5 TaxID=3078043 RepID=UPI00292D12FF|nr:recombinase family protein [Neglectibacter sp. CSJ-5]